MFETAYKHLIIKALNSPERKTRNAITRSFFGHHLEVDSLERGIFPILQGRKIYTQGILGEMAAFLKGPKTVKDFQDMGCNYWNDWGDAEGKLNVDYGNAWLDFNGVNQLEEVIESLRKDPNGRRHVISSWRPDHLKDLSLPCCHYSYQWYVTNEGRLEMIWNQRSVDIMIGLPSDIVLAAVWTLLIANELKLKPGKLHFMLGDCHIYDSHLDGVAKYLQQLNHVRTPSFWHRSPGWKLDKKATVRNFEPSMLEIIRDNAQPAIKFKLEV